MIFSHFSEEPLVLDLSRTYTPDMDGSISFKPRGLWLSDEASGRGWKEWCEDEQFRTETLKHRSDFKLKNSDKILKLTSVEHLDKFTEEFGTGHGYSERKSWIDWERVMREYSGIVITPYHWERRLSLSWYYPWDCASACIWDLSLVEAVNG